MAEQRLAFSPALNAFKQRAGLIPRRFASGLRGVEMNMRLDKRRARQATGGIQRIRLGGRLRRLRNDGADVAVANFDLP
jgi:hypothetical protein